MKKLYVALTFFGIIILMSSMSYSEQKRNISVKMNTLISDSIPVLPDEPYNYNGIEFPEEILTLMAIWGETFDPNDFNSQIDNETATLGRVLFYDKKLSGNNEISCASCHKQEFSFADNVAFSEGINGPLTTRNSPNLNDLEWGANNLLVIDIFVGGILDPSFIPGTHTYFWDCRDTSLATAVLQPIAADDELGKDMSILVNKLSNTSYYPDLFAAAFGDSQITTERIGTAMAHFIRSMVSFESKFDKAEQGLSEYTPAEFAGRNIFENSCGFFCHTLPNGGIKTPMNNGLDEIPEDPGAGTWINDEAAFGLFKSPSLRNIALTAPYMHDGRFETLEEVIDFYSEGIQSSPNSSFEWLMGSEFTGFDFSDSDKENLLAFLHTMTNETFINDPKFSNPFDENTVGIKPLPLLEKIVVYPNPVQDAVRITIENGQARNYLIELTTVDGKTIQSLQATGNELVMKLDDISKGLYFLKISQEERMQVVKLMVN